MAEHWDVHRIPDISGKVVVITGANSGIGFEAAQALAAAGAHVIQGVRNLDKGQRAAVQIRKSVSNALVETQALDLADLDSIHAFAETLLGKDESIDLLINNAGVMAPPYGKTKDGFELQLGTNHLGHFTLTGLLLPKLQQTVDARVVTVSSMAHKGGRIDFDNLDGSKGYKRWRAYGQSKIANLLFAYELQRRLRARGSSVKSIACHPGFAATNLTSAGFGRNMGVVGRGLVQVGNLAAQSARMGALPTLYAATEASLQGGEYIGPLGRSGMRGYPGIVKSNDLSHDPELAQRLWSVSEALTGVSFLSD